MFKLGQKKLILLRSATHCDVGAFLLHAWVAVADTIIRRGGISKNFGLGFSGFTMNPAKVGSC